uniref:AT-rich interaction domain 5A n=1 Tax=Pelusios castaneus TaxID=367368 RepID=A0A8C8RJE9_9SAUR
MCSDLHDCRGLRFSKDSLSSSSGPAPSFKGKRKKKTSTMEEGESQQTAGLGPMEEADAVQPASESSRSPVDLLDQVDSPAAKPDSSYEADQKQLVEETGDEQASSKEKEEEQAFLVNLYKFMKERHTPIERVPHLGFKQINLWKIYKAVEKLGAYELVTGRRLWKNVYDELGGSPGSTSAATCTRRHYERLVLPYVRHLKGEDDKPLPPAKPRKQYKVSREPRGEQGDDAAEKNKRVKKEKSGEQVLPEKVKPAASSTPKRGQEAMTDDPEQSRPGDRAKGLPLPTPKDVAKNQPSTSCHSSCRAHGCSEAYKRLFSSFYFKGNHGIMSPLAKKKLLAQVSKAEALHCHERHLSHCPEGKKARSAGLPCCSPELDSNRPSVIHQCKEGRSPVSEDEESSEPARTSQPPNRGEWAACPKGSLSPRGSQIFPRTEDGSSGRHLSPAPAILTGRFHAYRSEVLKPVSCHPLRGPLEYFPGFKDFPESPSVYQKPGKDLQPANPPRKRQDAEGSVGQPEDLRSKASQAPLSWSGDSQRSSAFYKGGPVGGRGSPFGNVKACWVSPMASFAKARPQLPKNSGLVQPIPQSQVGSPTPGPEPRSKRGLEEEGFVHRKKLKAVAPLVKVAEPKDNCGESLSLRQGLAKPQAVVPSPAFSAPLPSAAGQDVYKGTMLRFPVNFGSPADHLKSQSSPLIPSLSMSPFVIPAFPGPLLAASTQSSDLCRPLAASLVHYPTSYDSSLRHRLYPVSTWHNQPTYASPHGTTFHRNTKL